MPSSHLPDSPLGWGPVPDHSLDHCWVSENSWDISDSLIHLFRVSRRVYWVRGIDGQAVERSHSPKATFFFPSLTRELVAEPSLPSQLM